ncbi:MAG: hypothetical protein ABIJ18_04510 [archaeon]
MLEFIKKFTDKKIDYVKLKGKYYLKNDLELTSKKVFMPGFILGEDKDGKFLPSLGLLDILSGMTKEKIFLKDIGEIDFIFKKNLRPRHIERIEGEDKIGYLKLVQNEHDENLGYAKLKKDKRAKNIFDRGSFVRREKHL